MRTVWKYSLSLALRRELLMRVRILALFTSVFATVNSPNLCQSATALITNTTCVYSGPPVPSACSGSQLATCVLVATASGFQPTYLMADCPVATTCSLSATSAFCDVCHVPPTLGSCAAFSVFAKTSIVFSGVSTQVVSGTRTVVSY